MPKTVSNTFRAAMQASQINDDIVALLRFQHDLIPAADFPDGICLVPWHEDVTSNGIDYIACAIRAQMPSEDAKSLPRVPIEIDNLDPQYIDAMRLIDSPVQTTVSAILLSDPDTIELGPYDFELRQAKYDRNVITGELTFDPILNLAYPVDTYSPSRFPGLFQI